MSDLIHQIFQELWQDYVSLNPQLEKLEQLLMERGETIVNDHVAFRTFDHPKVNIEVFSRTFLQCGYEKKEDYVFPLKKLRASYFEPSEKTLPKVFISELESGAFSNALQESVSHMVSQIPEETLSTPDFLYSGRLWSPVTFSEYKALKSESEYAAWMAVFGFRANHFTISVNALKTFSDLPEFNGFMKSHGYVLNVEGGEVKGSKAIGLEQSSIMAGRVPCEFADGSFTIPACYYEFAQRYQVNGELFPGFIPDSADKIFESTHNKK